jgi:hypothetical protein
VLKVSVLFVFTAFGKAKKAKDGKKRTVVIQIDTASI